MIDLFYPYVPKEAIQAVTETLSTRWIGQGPKVDLFEKMFEKQFGVKYAVSLNSGTSALETAYDLIGIKEGDEVITTPLTCTATNLPIFARKAKIVWADIKEDTLTIDPEDVKRKITDKTKAIVAVHLGGIEADLGQMPVPVVSDACQALGIFTGDYTCNSFQAIKHITTGDGGMLTVSSVEEAKKAKLMRWFGIDREAKREAGWNAYKKREMTFDIEMVGFKRQMTDIAAAMGIVGLNKYDVIMEYRLRQFALYVRLLSGVDGLKIVTGNRNACWTFTLLVERRDDFAKKLYNAYIDSNLVQVRNDAYKIFGGRANLPVMDAVENKYISIPFGIHVTEENVRYICEVIKSGW